MSPLTGSIARNLRAPKSRKPRTRRPRLTLGTLEDRTVPTVYTVTTTAGDSSPGSLGAAILQANATPEADKIVFDTTGTFATPQTITLTAALPTIALDGGGLTITGPGRDNLAVDGAHAFRVLNSYAPTLTLNDFTITHGASAGNGGAVQAAGLLTLNSMAITNSVAAIFGGGINMQTDGDLAVQDSLISGNTAGISAGGIGFRYNGSLAMDNSTVSDNSVSNAPKPYYGGGGIGFYGDVGRNPGGAFAPGTLLIQNSTIANNSAGAGSGGGILLLQTYTFNSQGYPASATLKLVNCTITGNVANGSAGGGIANIGQFSAYPVLMTLQNSIVAGNTNVNAPDIYSAGPVNAQFSAIGSTTGITGTGNPTLDAKSQALVGANLMLGPLTDDGGELPTVAPQVGSPLIDAGNNAFVTAAGLATDERGSPFTRTFNTTVDIGAFEVQPDGTPFAVASPAPLTVAGGSTYTFQVTFADSSGSNRGIQPSSVTSSSIVVTNGVNPVTPTLLSTTSNADGSVTATYSIPAPNGTWSVNDDAVYTLSAVAGQVKDLDNIFVPAATLRPIDIFIPRTIVVTSTADDGSPGTFRAAIFAAAFGSDDTITFDPAVFSTPQVINLESALPILGPTTGGLTVDGPGADLLTIRRDPALPSTTTFRVFATEVPDLTLSDFTLSGGTVSAAGDATLGNTGTGTFSATFDHMVITGNNATGTGAFAGGLYVDGFMTAILRDSQVTQNTAATNDGGIIEQTGALLTVQNSTISGNSAGGIGGGITVAADGHLKLIDSTVSNNTAATYGGGIFIDENGSLEMVDSTVSGNSAGTVGGGIFFNYGGALSISGSTISGNRAISTTKAGGGGIFFYGAYRLGTLEPVTITNSTIANNRSGSTGGGIMLDHFGRTLDLVNSTVTGNTATASTGGGGGIGTIGTPAIVLRNSIVAGNTNAAAPDIATSGQVTAAFSAIGSTTGITTTPTLDTASQALLGANLMLGLLADNGGPTQTVAPLLGSPLIDAGNNADATAAGLTTDQRGLPRLDPTSGTVDIGAVEAQAAIPTITVDPAQTNPTNDPSQVTFDVTFDQAVTGFDASQIDLSASTATGALTAAVTQVDATHYTVTVTGIAGDGTVEAAVLPGTGAEGLNGSGQPNLASAGSATVTVDTTPPTVTVDQDVLQLDPTNANPIAFLVQFSEPVGNFTAGDVTLGGTLAPFATITGVSQVGATNSYVVDVTINGSHTGTITATVAAGVVTDPAGNPNDASTSTDNSVTFDNIAPTVTVTPEAGQGATVGGTAVVFDVAFSEPVAGFTAAAVDLAGTVDPGAAASVTDSGDHTNFTVTVSGMTGSAPVAVTIDNGAVQDLAGNDNVVSNTASVNYEHTGTVQFSAPTYTINEQGAPTLSVVVTRTGGSDGQLAMGYATADVTARAGIDYTAESGFLHWDAGDTSDQTINIPILDDGNLEFDSAFDITLTSFALPGVLGTPSTATVNILEEAGLGFSATDYPVDEAVGSAVVVVHRSFDTHGQVTVDYTTSNGTATAGQDYTTTSGTLTWADGDNADQTILVPITDDTVNEGRETINLTLSNPTGNALAGPNSTATISIAPSDGVTVPGAPPKGQKSSATIADADGDQVVLALGGKVGSLTYYLTDGVGPISEIDLAGTDPTTSTVTVTVKTPKGGTGDGRTDIGEVDGTGFKTFTATKSDLVGAGFDLTGFAGAIKIGNVLNGADITLGGSQPTPKSATTITAGVIGDGTVIGTGAPIKSLTAIAIGQGTIDAPSIGAIKVKGQKATKTLPAIAGDFQSDVIITGQNVDPVKGKALGSLSVAGAVSGASISVEGNVGTVTVGSFLTSELFAGYGGPTDGSGKFSGSFTVGPFVTKSATVSFADSYVIATSIKAVTLSTLDSANGGVPFGFDFNGTAGGTFGGLTVKAPKLSYDKKTGGSQQLLGDFGVVDL